MAKAYYIDFVPVEQPLKAVSTKFGGQPCWIEAPQWPISKTTGNPMRFICQIALSEFDIFCDQPAKMAYFFMADDENDKIVETWDPESGDSAVILQPGSPSVSIQPLSEGRSLEQWHEIGKTSLLKRMFSNKSKRTRIPCEFAVRFTDKEDPDNFENLPEEELEGEYGTKIGGSPQFVQYSEYPKGGPWKLLLQIDSCNVPFEINLGDAGVGHVFIAQAGNDAKFLWQCF